MSLSLSLSLLLPVSSEKTKKTSVFGELQLSRARAPNFQRAWPSLCLKPSSVQPQLQLPLASDESNARSSGSQETEATNAVSRRISPRMCVARSQLCECSICLPVSCTERTERNLFFSMILAEFFTTLCGTRVGPMRNSKLRLNGTRKLVKNHSRVSCFTSFISCPSFPLFCWRLVSLLSSSSGIHTCALLRLLFIQFSHTASCPPISYPSIPPLSSVPAALFSHLHRSC